MTKQNNTFLITKLNKRVRELERVNKIIERKIEHRVGQRIMGLEEQLLTETDYAKWARVTIEKLQASNSEQRNQLKVTRICLVIALLPWLRYIVSLF